MIEMVLADGGRIAAVGIVIGLAGDSDPVNASEAEPRW